MAEACSQAAMVARDHHHPHDSDNDNDSGATMTREGAVVGELREPLSLCYAAADKVTTDPNMTHPFSTHSLIHSLTHPIAHSHTYTLSHAPSHTHSLIPPHLLSLVPPLLSSLRHSIAGIANNECIPIAGFGGEKGTSS